MKVSIICTNYNKGDWVREAMDSFLNQRLSLMMLQQIIRMRLFKIIKINFLKKLELFVMK